MLHIISVLSVERSLMPPNFVDTPSDYPFDELLET